METVKVLLVEDEEDIREMVHFNLFKERYEVLLASDGKMALEIANNETPDLIILDLSEPSNPWVSGVSNLFSMEFYDLISNYINDDGLFIQWMHLYEINISLVS